MVENAKLESASSTLNDAAVELPITKPFEGYTYIKKEWVDQEDGIDKVIFHMTLSHVNQPADWNNTESHVMMPEWGSLPLRRAWIVRLPSYYEGADKYLFHYFFQVFYNNAKEKISPTFTQLIVPKEFEYIDYSGDVLFIRLHWSVGNWTYPQDTEMEIDGIEWGSEFSVSQAVYRRQDLSFQKGRWLKIKRLKPPHRFRCLIWVPKGSEIHYCFNIIKFDGEKTSSFWDNNWGNNYQMNI